MNKKIITAMLAGAMMLSLLPSPLSSIALAEEETLIDSRADLEAIQIDPSRNYRLTADIDLTGGDWTPLPAFTGKLDGGDHVIKNLSITDTNGNYKGLFASIAGSGRVCNLGMEGVNITAGNNTGAIAGTNSGNISRCYTTGTLSGNAYAGGITGANIGTIENCYSRVSVSGKSYLGGLAGSNSGKITKSYAAATVTDSVMNNYLEFNAAQGSSQNGYISIPNIDAYKATDFTLEAWFYWNNADTDEIDFIIGKGFEQFEIHTGGNSGINGLRFIPVPVGTTDGYHGDSWIDVHDALQTGWFHVAAVYSYDSSQTNQNVKIQIYINGEPQNLWQKPSSVAAAVNVGKIATLTRSSNPLASNTEPMNIGRRTDGSFYFNGKIADVRFWDTARTGEQIKVNKGKVLQGTEDGLVGYWKLNDSLTAPLEGQQVADVSINHNSGTIHGDVTQTTATGTALNKGALVGSNSGAGTVTSCFYDLTLYGSASGGAGTAEATAEMKTQSTFAGWDFDAVWKIAGSDYPNLGFKTVTSITVLPAAPSVVKGDMKRFSATVGGANNPAQAVTWSVTGGIAGTTIDASGNLTVAAGETAKELTVKATSTADTAKYGTATVTVTAATHGITVKPATLSFGMVNGAYTQPATQTVTVTYTGNIGSVTLTQPTSTDYSIGTLSRTTLDTTNATATFTVQPKANLITGVYASPITVATDKDSNAAAVTPSFTVNGAFSVDITGDLDIIAGESATLTAHAVGGSGTFTYQWFKDTGATAFSTANPVTVSPTVTTTYKVITHDTIEDRSAQATVTVTAATHGIKISPATLSFGTVIEGYAPPAAQTITITYTGNIGTVTLTPPTSMQYDIGALSRTVLDTANPTATFSVRPKAGLSVGTYRTPISIGTTLAQAPVLTVTPSFTVDSIHDLVIRPNAEFMQGNAPETTITVGAGTTGFGLDNFVSAEMGPRNGVLTLLREGKNFDKTKGSIIVTLRRSYLNTLVPGIYTLRINLKNLPEQNYPSYVETTIIVNASNASVPKTGDAATPWLWLGFVMMAGMGLAACAFIRRKRLNG